MSESIVSQIVAHMPRLRKQARHFCGDRQRAEDLVQETLLRALLHIDHFTPGTNLLGWLSVILRNCYFNELRCAKRLVSLDMTGDAIGPVMGQSQEAFIEMQEVAARIKALPLSQQQALNLVAVEGYSYEDAAAKMGCAVGTMKSRVCRARIAIQGEGRIDSQADARHALNPLTWAA